MVTLSVSVTASGWCSYSFQHFGLHNVYRFSSGDIGLLYCVYSGIHLGLVLGTLALWSMVSSRWLHIWHVRFAPFFDLGQPEWTLQFQLLALSYEATDGFAFDQHQRYSLVVGTGYKGFSSHVDLRFFRPSDFTFCFISFAAFAGASSLFSSSRS